jgi:hypothetical protein
MVARERFGQVGNPLFEHRATTDHLALVACESTSTSSWRSRSPVGIRLRVIDLLYCSRHPDLSMHREEPMEEDGGDGILS